MNARDENARPASGLDDLVSAKIAAKMIHRSEGALAVMRMRRLGPRFIKSGSARTSRIFYRVSDIRAWLDAHTVETEIEEVA